MAKPASNITSSVRQRLLNLARQEQQVFDVVLVAFGLERLLYRLSISSYRDRFVLKGGMLVTLWTADPGRFTRDVDFLAFGNDDETSLKEAFGEILSIDTEDGLVFDAASLTASMIREDHVYGGMRLKTVAHLGTTRIPITIDLGFGDALVNSEYRVDYGSLLDFPMANIRAYSPATVVAEKFQAIVALGIANGRMKDFYDLWALPKSLEIGTDELVQALQSTFERRETDIPDQRPPGLSSDFGEDRDKKSQWSAYTESTDLEEKHLMNILDEIWDWLEPICRQAIGTTQVRTQEF